MVYQSVESLSEYRQGDLDALEADRVFGDIFQYFMHVFAYQQLMG